MTHSITFSSLRCSCGKRRASLLRDDLHDLIEKYGLAEMLDRLADLIDAQSQCVPDEATEHIWQGLVFSIEDATQKALNLNAIKGEEAWR